MTSVSTRPMAAPAGRDHVEAWRRFLLGLLGLGGALLLAVLGTLLRDSGEFTAGAAAALASLVLAATIGVKTVPYLARRTVLRKWALGVDYRLTRRGIVYMLMAVALAAAALNTGNNLLYMMLATLLAGMMVSGVASLLALAGLEADLALPDHIFAGQPLDVRLTLRNRKRLLPSFALAALPGCGPRSPHGAQGAQAGILQAPLHFAYLAAGTSATQRARIEFRRRGRYREESLRIRTEFPFGLFLKTRSLAMAREAIVFPAIQPTEEFYEILPLISGELESFNKGRGHDLYAIRDYQPGDSARHVDWKASAKGGGLKVREFAREDERRVMLVFDPHVEPGSGTPEAFEKAVEFSACLAWHFYEIGAQMQFVTRDFETPMERADGVIYAALEKLATIEPCARGGLPGAGTPETNAFRVIVTSRPRGSIPTDLWGSAYLVFFDSL